MTYTAFVEWLRVQGWPGVVYLSLNNFHDLWEETPIGGRAITAYVTTRQERRVGRVIWIWEKEGMTMVLCDGQPTQNESIIDRSDVNLESEVRMVVN